MTCLDPEEVQNKYTHFLLDPGDYVVSSSGTLGRIAEVFEEDLPCMLNTSVIRFRPLDSERLDRRYLKAFLRSDHFNEQILAHANGSAQLNYGPTHLKQMSMPLPPLSAQKVIGDTLGALDDHIDNLRQTNATLEAIAQALFKSWFVDFDPVRAKVEGREPEGMDPATAALFPSEFEDSELGPIPKGWLVTTLANEIEAERGLSYKGSGLTGWGNGVPMHNLNSVLEGGGYKYAGIKYYSGDYKDRHVAVAGDIIVANTEQGHHHRLIGFPAMVPSHYSTGLFSHHLYRVRPRATSVVNAEWIFWCLKVPSVRDQIIGCANGSTVNMLKPAGLQIPQFILPTRDLCSAFASIAGVLRRQSESNVNRLDTLSDLRDVLLPRLISGKLRLPEAEREIEAATA